MPVSNQGEMEVNHGMKEAARVRIGITGLIVLVACLQVPHAFVECLHAHEDQPAAKPAGAVRALGENRLGMRFVEIPSGSFEMGSTIGPGSGWDLPAFFIHAALLGPWDPIHRRGFRLVYVPGKPGVSR